MRRPAIFVLLITTLLDTFNVLGCLLAAGRMWLILSRAAVCLIVIFAFGRLLTVIGLWQSRRYAVPVYLALAVSSELIRLLAGGGPNMFDVLGSCAVLTFWILQRRRKAELA
jgi:hypothetical protein